MPYIGKSPEMGVRTRYYYTVSANDTSVSGSDDNSKTLTFSDGEYVDVYLNGVSLVAGTDYNTSTANTIAGISAMAANDVVEVVVYDVFSVFSGDISGDLSVGANLTVTGVGTLASLDISGDIDVDGTSNLDIIDVDGAANFAADVTFADGADIITASAGTSNLRIGVNAGNSITSGGNYNVCVGDEAGTAITTADANVAIGYNAGSASVEGGGNVAIGYQALDADVGGQESVAIGANALGAQNFSSGTRPGNNGIGLNAGTSITSGIGNNIMGTFAGDALTDADYNVAIGHGALSADTLGSKSIAIGANALLNQNFTSATNGLNVAIGHDAGYQVTTGTDNTIIGGGAGDAVTTGSNNVAVGSSALGAVTTGSGIIGIGKSAGLAHTTTAGGVYIGHVAGFNSTALNTCIGYLAAYSDNGATSLTSGSGNTLLGSYTGVAGATDTNSVVIGHNATGKGSNTGFLSPTSGVYQGNNSSSWSTTSDQRLKKNITDSTIGLAEINKIKVRNYEYKTKNDLAEIESDGLVEADIVEIEGVQVSAVAQELQSVLPKCVIEQDTGVLSVNTDNLTWHLVKAVQELSTALDAAVARIKTLEDG